MTIVLNEKSLDWALAHICRYCDSDHFPRIFEFSAIRENWPKVKKYILSINLDGYTPQPPLIRFAPRLNGTHRVVHRLDPIDSLIYAAMVHEMHETAEGPREPEPLRIVASRIAPSNDGQVQA